jgi:uroporphyrinogen decarboxylase
MPRPDFERLRTALFCGQPDRVPIAELKVEDQVKSAFLGKPMGNPKEDLEAYLRNDIEFSLRAGYDYVRLTPTVSYPEPSRAAASQYSLYSPAATTRAWAEQHQGAVTSWEEFEKFPFPTAEEVDYRPLEIGTNLLPHGMKALTSIKGGGIWERVWRLMGFEALAFALRENPELVAAVFKKIGQFYLDAFRRIAPCPGVEGLWLGDDLGYTEGLLISPTVYRRHLFPWYEELAAICRQNELAFIFHSDGALWEVLDDLLALGINALHPIEPKAMDIAELKRRFGDRLCLIGNIDLGYTLTRGAPAEVEAEVRLRLKQCAPGGGYCVGSSNTVTEYVPLDNFRAMIEAARTWGAYPLRADL